MASRGSQLEKLLSENINFAETARGRLDQLLRDKFTFRNFVEIQKKSFALDLFINPLNALWLFPYLVIKKFVEIADKLGFEKFSGLSQKIPPTIKTSFQLKLDQMVAAEIFQPDVSCSEELTSLISKNVREEVRAYGIKQSGISDLTSSGVTFFLAHQFFGNSSLGIFQIAQNIAQIWERDEAASKFFLGKKIGKAFYDITPAPEASAGKFALAAMLLLIFVSLVTTLVSFVFPLIQRRLGFQKQNLLKLVGAVESKSALQITNKLMKTETPRLPLSS